jgi:hypothetical protein
MHFRSLSLPVLFVGAGTLSGFALMSCGMLDSDNAATPKNPASTVAPDANESGTGETGANDPGTVAANVDGDAPSDGGFCPLDDSASLASNGNGPDQVVASGSAKGDSVDCSFCGAGVNLTTSADTGVVALSIASGVSSSCSTPSDAMGAWVNGQLHLDAAKPGVYRAHTGTCNDLAVGYLLPYEAGTVIVDCGDSGVFHGPATCPAGCISSCIDTGEDGGVELCSPCESTQSQPSVQYSLENGCPSAASAIQFGAWTVTLTSVVPAVVPADAGFLPGTAAYTAHGSLTATLDRYTSASSPTVTLTLEF